MLIVIAIWLALAGRAISRLPVWGDCGLMSGLTIAA